MTAAPKPSSESENLEDQDGPTLFPFPRPVGRPLCLAHAYTEHRETADAARVKVWNGAEPYLATNYEATKKVLDNEDVFSADPLSPGYVERNAAFAATVGYDRTFRTMDGEEHVVKRSYVVEDFSRRRLNILKPLIQAKADSLVEDMVDKGPEGDLVNDLALPLAITGLAEIIGVAESDREYFAGYVSACVSGGTAEEARAASAELGVFTDRLMVEKKETPGDDMATRVVAKVDEGLFTHKEALDTLRMLLIGGFETTANSLGLGLLGLLTDDDARALLLSGLEDEKFMINATNEIVRFASTLQLGPRRVAVAPGAVGDVPVEPGDAVICSPAAANFDPAVFEEPDRLKLDRPNAHLHLGFGYGSHACQGQGLARMEIIAALRSLFRRIPDVRLAVDVADIPVKDPGDQTFGPRELLVTW